MERYLHSIVKKSLGRKIIFLGGPRQVGKTTFSFQLLGKGAGEEHPAYLSWDFPKNRKMLMEGVLPAGQKLIVLDEIHKYRQWRNLVKGLYDKNKSRFQFLVTGSAKLDYYRRGGDSLAGRYEYYRLHPLSLYEISSKPTKEQFKRLLAFGGFPEMYLEGNRHSWKKWQRMRLSQLIRDDLVSLEQVRDLSQVETLHLCYRRGSPQLFHWIPSEGICLALIMPSGIGWIFWKIFIIAIAFTPMGPPWPGP